MISEKNENKERWSVLGDEEVDLLNICLDAKLKVIKYDEEKENGDGGKYKVCKGIRELEEMRRAEGKAEGKAEGEKNFNRLLNTLAAQGYQLTEILAMTSDEKNRAKLYEKYGIV